MSANLLKKQVTTGTYISNFLKNTKQKQAQDKQTASYYEARLQLLENYWSLFFDKHSELLDFESELGETDYFVKNYFDIVENAYVTAKATLNDDIRSMRPPSAPPQTPLTATQKTDDVSVPLLSLPTFSGKHDEWESFKQRFCSMIKDRPSLSNVGKLQHLLNCVQGEAAHRLKGIEITEANFALAWDKLVRRFDNTHLRLYNNLESLIQLPAARPRNLQDLNLLIDRTEETVRALKDLDCPVQHYDNWIVHCIVRKLDLHSRESWQISRESKTGFPKYTDLIDFIERRVRSLEQARVSIEPKEASTVNSSVFRSSHPKSNRISVNAVHTSGSFRPPIQCILCHEDHILSACCRFRGMTQKQRFEFVKHEKLCLNCLQKTHFLDKCLSNKRCFVCQGKHHSLLHDPNKSDLQANSSSSHTTFTEESNPPQTVDFESLQEPVEDPVQTYTASITGTVLLATAQIIVEDQMGNTLTIRALVDPVAERSFITERVANQLSLKSKRILISIVGVGAEVSSRSRKEVTFNLRSAKDSQFVRPVSTLVLPELTRLLPRQKLVSCNWSHIKGLDLADPHFANPSHVDCIIGADIYPDILLSGLIRGEKDTPIAQKTIFGWILTGKSASSSCDCFSSQIQTFHTFSEASLSDSLLKFWETEEIPTQNLLTKEEQFCEAHFTSTYFRNDTGRFVVSLPFPNPPSFVGSRDIAIACLLRSEKRMAKNPALAVAYHSFLAECLQLKHMEPVPSLELHRSSYYMGGRKVEKSE